MRNKPLRKTARQGRIETLERREVMSADPLADLLGGRIETMSFVDDLPPLEQQVLASPPDSLPPLEQTVEGSTPDFWITDEDRALLDGAYDGIEQFLTEAHNVTGWYSVQSNYGFDGSGQTVAVIDTGVAYNHYALGGGFGANYRVVGGWDFTEENDADPYDDGTSGSHGSHVAGIIGSSDSNHHGVASGVDLVGLRVFNDAGAGYFSWVESALRWVHDHRNDFENPITAVNLSIGVSSWNSESIPLWANLEEEFAQLEADGIFIAVAAGNGFQSFNTTGLSYPAASSHVVPVMSVDDSGLLSYYSQRSTRAIATPGRSIVSTAPDWAGNNNGIDDDFKTMSGTSMASPYMAGASVLIREAMQFAGMTNITQATIYNHVMATADSFVDSATGATFKRLNLQRAIDSVMPTDDYGSTIGTASDWGSLSSSRSVGGAIANLSDADYFTFTAGASGTVTVNATAQTYDMASRWVVYNSQGTAITSPSANSTSFQVVAGQRYTLGLSSSNGLGYYSFDVNFAQSAPAPTPIDWGVVSFNQHADENVASEKWYKVTASQAGYLTAVANFSAGGGAVTIAAYTTDFQLIAAGSTSGTTARVDVNAAQGQQFLLKITGTNSDVDVTLANLVSQVGSTVTVNGTAGNDAVTFSAGSSSQYLTVNGVGYGFSGGGSTSFTIHGGQGANSITVYGSTAQETVTVRVGSSTVVGQSYTIEADGFATQDFSGGGGNDLALMYGAAGADTYRTYADRVEMTGASYQNRAAGFAQTYGYADGVDDVTHMYGTAGADEYRVSKDYAVMSGAGYYNAAVGFIYSVGYGQGGLDQAWVYGSTGADTYRTYCDRVVMQGAGFYNLVANFDLTYGFANHVDDTAYMYGSPKQDLYRTYSDRAIMEGPGYYNRATGFTKTYGYADSANDVAAMYGSAGADQYRVSSAYAIMSGANYNNTAAGFAVTYGYATGANDQAWLYGSTGADAYRTYSDRVTVTGAGYYNLAAGFTLTYSIASGVNDVAYMYGSTGADQYRTYADRVIMSNANYYNRASGFAKTYGYADGANDVAWMYGSTGADEYRVSSTNAVMSGTGYYNAAAGFATTYGYGQGGTDQAWLYGSVGADVYAAYSTYATMTGPGYANRVDGFALTYGFADSLDDIAYLYDSTGDDIFRSYSDRSIMSGNGYYNRATGFKRVIGYASSGNDEAQLYDGAGNDSLTARVWGAYLELSTGVHNEARGFDKIIAYGQNGGTNTSDEEAVDFIFSKVGAWL